MEEQIVSTQGDELSIIDPQVMLARKFPRDEKKALEKLTFALQNTSFYEVVEYAIPRKDRDDPNKIITITGPTVYLAKEVLKVLTNFRFEQGIYEIKPTDTVVTAYAMCWDLENNVSNKVSVSRPIVTKNGYRFGADMVNLTSMSASSVAVRNAIFNVVPRYIVDECLRLAKERENDELRKTSPNDKHAKIKMTWEKFQKLCKATDEEMTTLFKVNSFEDLDDEGYKTIKRLYTAVDCGDTTPADLFNRERGVRQHRPGDKGTISFDER